MKLLNFQFNEIIINYISFIKYLYILMKFYNESAIKY